MGSTPPRRGCWRWQNAAADGRAGTVPWAPSSCARFRRLRSSLHDPPFRRPHHDSFVVGLTVPPASHGLLYYSVNSKRDTCTTMQIYNIDLWR